MDDDFTFDDVVPDLETFETPGALTLAECRAALGCEALILDMPEDER